jgi:hypothetical protein
MLTVGNVASSDAGSVIEKHSPSSCTVTRWFPAHRAPSAAQNRVTVVSNSAKASRGRYENVVPESTITPEVPLLRTALDAERRVSPTATDPTLTT